MTAVFLVFFITFLGNLASADFDGVGVTYQGRILDREGRPLVAANVPFRLSIYSPKPGTPECLLYSEQFTVNMSSGDGSFSLILGRMGGLRTDTSSLSFEELFNPELKYLGGSQCPLGYQKKPAEALLLKVEFDVAGTTQALEPISMTAVPTAIETLQVAGIASGRVLRVAVDSEAPGLSANHFAMSPRNFEDFVALLNGTSAKYATARVPGQPIIGGLEPNENLILDSTSDVRKGNIILNPIAGDVGVGTSTPAARLDVIGSIKADSFRTRADGPPMLPIYIQGTGKNSGANRLVRIGGTTVVDSGARGLNLTVVSVNDYSVISSTDYDTYGSAVEADNLAKALSDLTRDRIGILTSADSYNANITANLTAAASRLGLYKLAGFRVYPHIRRSYSAIFQGSGTGTDDVQIGRNAIEAIGSHDPFAPHAIIATWLM